MRRLCSVGDVAPNSSIRVVVDDRPIAVVRIGDDFYAIGDTCSHAEVSLSQGEVLADSCELECIKHGSAFSLTTGEPSTLPATEPVPVYQLQVIGDDVMVVNL